MKKFLMRLSSGVGLLALMIIAIYLGSYWLFGAVLLTTLIALKELFGVFAKMGYKLSYPLAALVTLLLFSAVQFTDDSLFELVFFMMVAVGMILLTFTNWTRFQDICAFLFGIMYIPYFMSFIIRLSGSPYIWFIVIAAWGTDTFAYIFGMLLGKKKLFERISPKKTVEGAIGGLVGAVVLAFLATRLLELSAAGPLMAITGFGSIFAQAGDFCASYFKRIAQIKDYGDLIPGHGGIMDRFDSILFAAPFIYFAITTFVV